MRKALRICAAWLGVALATAVVGLDGVTEAAQWDGAAPASCCDPGDSDAMNPLTCCRICTKGKACGNSCIARDKDCYQPPGCACDG